MTKAEVFIIVILAFLIGDEFLDPRLAQWILSLLSVPVFVYALYVSPHIPWTKSKTNGTKNSKVRSIKSAASSADNK